MTGARFSRIVIIQSLPAGDSPTGRHLRDAIEPTAEALRNIPVEFIDARSGCDFWKALDGVHDTVEGVLDYPILHLECHGISDGSGLSLADGTPVTWSELKTPLAKLNHATCCSMFVTLAACYGARLMEALDIQDRSPCWGLLGPSAEVSPADLIGSYSAFFMELLHSANADAAIAALRNSPACRAHYFIFTAEDMFQNVLRLYKATCSTKAQLTAKTEEFTRIFKKRGFPDAVLSSVGAEISGAEFRILERFYKRFFCVDRCPENTIRFPYAYSALVQ